MLIGCTILLIALSVFVIYKPKSAWTMLFSWWRQAKPDDALDSVSVHTTGYKHISEDDTVVEDVKDAEEEDGASTPRAEPQFKTSPIPSFALNPSADFSSDEEDNLPPPQFPAMNSAQRASAPSKPPVPKFVETTGASISVPSKVSAPRLSTSPGLLPPPSSGTMRPPTLTPVGKSQSSSSGFRTPASGPLPNRAPPNLSSSLSVQLTSSVAQPNSRKKVVLAPGHSPLDWAHLQKTNPSLSGVSGFQRVTPSILKYNNGRKGRPAWASYQGRVYNISPYLPFHPGGEGELRRCAGKDGEKLFNEVHPWVNWDNMMGQCLVGMLVSENDHRVVESSLEDMD